MPDNRTSDEISVNKYIEVKAGFTDETVLEFPNEGHESIGQKTGILRIKFKQTPDPFFKWISNDLIYTYPISLADAL